MTCNCIGGNPCPCQRGGLLMGRVDFGPNYTAAQQPLISTPWKLSVIEHFWERAQKYTGQNFFVRSWNGSRGKPHLKLCREDQCESMYLAKVTKAARESQPRAQSV